MWEIGKKTEYGANVSEVVQTKDCLVLKLHDETGDGMMTMYSVFPGTWLMYNDFHMKSCMSGFQTKLDLLCIDHCREGCIEQEVTSDTYSYLEAGDLRVDRRINHTGKVSFPLCHYHGISIAFHLDEASEALKKEVRDFPINLYEIQKKYCQNSKPYVIAAEPIIQHIFSELYHVPTKIKNAYFRIKILELLLYLDALEINTHKEERPYFYKGQVEKIKAVQKLITSDLTKHYTIKELSERFDIAMTPLKNCFKVVYGSPIFSYVRMYRMNYAATLLRKNKEYSISKIAGMVGYDSPSKFSAAFHQVMGKTPMEYRKSFI